MSETIHGIRPPAVAGSFYPRQPQRLRDDVQRLLAEAQDAQLDPVRGLIVPHAGYIYSGAIAASGFRQLTQPGHADRPTIYLLGPAHYVPVASVALAPFASFDTPLGPVQQDKAAVNALAQEDHIYGLAARAHEPEHCLEVELPFLQMVLSDFRLVAMLCGHPPIDQVAQDLAQRLQPGDLVVVSSDLSHFHSYEEAQLLDRQLLDHVVSGDLQAAASGEACGLQPILILMRLAQILGWQPHLLDYRNSGDTGGDRWRVVGYAAVAYT